MKSNYRIVNTETLRELVKHAERNHLNRVPPIDHINLDPDGYHVLGLILYGHNMDSGVVLHHRCQVLVKQVGTDDPLEVWLDVLDADWQRLPDAVELLSAE